MHDLTYVESKEVRFMEAGSRMVSTGFMGQGMEMMTGRGKIIVKGYKVQLYKSNKFS
jgi:hypothetical protein